MKTRGKKVRTNRTRVAEKARRAGPAKRAERFRWVRGDARPESRES